MLIVMTETGRELGEMDGVGQDDAARREVLLFRFYTTKSTDDPGIMAHEDVKLTARMLKFGKISEWRLECRLGQEPALLLISGFRPFIPFRREAQ